MRCCAIPFPCVLCWTACLFVLVTILTAVFFTHSPNQMAATLRLAAVACMLVSAAAETLDPMLMFNRKYPGDFCVLPSGCGADTDCTVPPPWEGFNRCNSTSPTIQNDRQLCTWVKAKRAIFLKETGDVRYSSAMDDDEKRSWVTSHCYNFMFQKDAQCAVRVS